MTVILWFTLALVAAYLLYPAALRLMKPVNLGKNGAVGHPYGVSVILLTYNGKPYIEAKIGFLLKELSAFPQGELIIIDDCSTDGTTDVLERYREAPGVRLLLKSVRTGIAGSMNTAVGMAAHDIVVFCDQRQRLSDNCLRRIVGPLSDERVGAVSGCLSHMDKGNKDSLLRRHENFLKTMESRTGSVIGVYGPFYAIRKECYAEIPQGVILDDLYLSLHILRSKRIVMEKECTITDDDHAMLYDYLRTRRYLLGLLQILADKGALSGLGTRQRIMLLWHKYLRLLVPVALFASYVSTGILAMHNAAFLIIFALLTLVPGIAFIPSFSRWHARLGNLFRMNVFYLLAFTDILSRYVRTGGKP
jgi:biofilm PGA synthesis N-glycosyltransferase PgaC